MINPLGFTVYVNRPVYLGGEPIGEFPRPISSYDHEISADEGYKRATIGFTGNQMDMDEWLGEGLGREIVTIAADGTEAWRGFVNKVTAKIGGVTLSYGPLIETVNRVVTWYVPILDAGDPATNTPPILGERQPTLASEDEASQRRYGILERILSTGNAWPDDVDNAQEVFLEEHKAPTSSTEISIGDKGSTIEINIECLGHYEWFKIYVYNGGTGLSVEASTKVTTVVAADPNGIFSTDVSKIDFNGYLVLDSEDEDRTAEAILRSITTVGDINYTRWILGVYENRRVYYEAVSDDLAYLYHIMETASFLTDYTGAPVPHLKIRPGRWLYIPDLLVGRNYSTRRDDPRYIFIESVKFTSPNRVTITGSRSEKLSQRLEQIGLGGMS
jgi:hypothetical protein